MIEKSLNTQNRSKSNQRQQVPNKNQMINKNFYNNMTTRDEMNASREELQAAQQQQVNGRGVVRDLVNIY